MEVDTLKIYNLTFSANVKKIVKVIDFSIYVLITMKINGNFIKLT